MRSTSISFPWLVRLGCGCSFTRLELTNGDTHRHWDPCGAHMVLAAAGFTWPWPPSVEQLEREPVPV